MPNQDSTQSGIPITVEFTQQGRACLPPSIIEAFKTANWRATFTDSGPVDPNTAVMRVSDLSDNIARLDTQGAIYVPGETKFELAEATINIGTSVAPGTMTEVSFAIPASVIDLNNVLLNVFWEVSPPERGIYVSPPFVSANRLRFNITRLHDEGVTAPYTALVVKGTGRLFIKPSPSPS
jgi:hypothetical protein